MTTELWRLLWRVRTKSGLVDPLRARIEDLLGELLATYRADATDGNPRLCDPAAGTPEEALCAAFDAAYDAARHHLVAEDYDECVRSLHKASRHLMRLQVASRARLAVEAATDAMHKLLALVGLRCVARNENVEHVATLEGPRRLTIKAQVLIESGDYEQALLVAGAVIRDVTRLMRQSDAAPARERLERLRDLETEAIERGHAPSTTAAALAGWIDRLIAERYDTLVASLLDDFEQHTTVHAWAEPAPPRLAEAIERVAARLTDIK